MLIASIESLIGSLAFAGVCLLAGYILGNVFGFSKLKALFGK